MPLDTSQQRQRRLLPLSRHNVDRDDLGRSSASHLEALAADPSARVLVLCEGKSMVAGLESGGTQPIRLALIPFSELPTPTPDAARHAKAFPRLYLGRSLSESSREASGTPIFAVTISEAEAEQLGNARGGVDSDWMGLREIAIRLDDRDSGLFTEAQALANWHRSHRYCPRCGTATVVDKGGWVRRCPVENSDVFPRTDPAVIVAITDDDDRLLLGSNAAWPAGRYSVLAGFVEAGESLEAAVLREMHEESGLRVVEPTYWGSQPWPFPASIMLGFTARVAPGVDPDALRPDGEEILELRWFSREELAASLEELTIPAPLSIARALIEDWFGGPLDDGASPA